MSISQSAFQVLLPKLLPKRAPDSLKSMRAIVLHATEHRPQAAAGTVLDELEMISAALLTLVVPKLVGSPKPCSIEASSTPPDMVVGCISLFRLFLACLASEVGFSSLHSQSTL